MMQATITRLLDEWLPKGKFDFEEFASYFPISVMFNLVGAPVDQVAGIRSSLETLGLALSMDKRRVPAIQEAYGRLEDLVLRLIAQRRAAPESDRQDDLLQLLITTGGEGAISERQLADLIIFFFIAGYDTSKNVFTFTMHLLMQHPEIYERCAADRDYCRKVLEEALRYYSPGSIPRFSSQDFAYRDVLIPKDEMIMFAVPVSGRDPQIFADPDEFNPERRIEPDKRHVAFGLGKHMCLGQHIARAQLQEGLHQVTQRIRNPRLVGTLGWRPFPGIWGLKGLPIEFTPAPTRTAA
jgi:cytochrome P450